MEGRGMCTVIVAAHNEERVIGRCLDALLGGADAGEFEVIVAANGCTDRTADVARRDGVTVLDLPRLGKAEALNAAERVATRFPRVYIDADVRLDTDAVRALRDAVRPDGPLAAAGSRSLDVRRRPLLVRAYYAVNRHMPAYEDALFGRGTIALSETGRRRFDVFPDLLADDLFLDSLFSAAEKTEVGDATAVIATPWTTRDLVRRLVRVRRANDQFRIWAVDHRLPTVRPSRRWSWLREVVVPRFWLAPAGVVYAAITVVSQLRASQTAQDRSWGRDESSRNGSRVSI
jgi:glycosyltransferase involved in cell wall biosynthesis